MIGMTPPGRLGLLEQTASAISFLASDDSSFCTAIDLGVPLSMRGDPPLLGRKILQCHDLATAATKPALLFLVACRLDLKQSRA
jgi:hypothetical protein